MSTTSISTATRVLDGVEIPEAGEYVLDASHSHVGFSVRHLMVSKVKGRFGEFRGTVRIAEDPLESSVDVEIDTASIDTGDAKRDEHLRSGDFFDVVSHPVATYVSSSVRPAGRRKFQVDGELTIAGVSKPVGLEVTIEGVGQDPWGGVRIGFEAAAEIDRETFGLSWNQALETGGMLVGKQVKLEIEAQAVRQ